MATLIQPSFQRKTTSLSLHSCAMCGVCVSLPLHAFQHFLSFFSSRKGGLFPHLRVDDSRFVKEGFFSFYIQNNSSGAGIVQWVSRRCVPASATTILYSKTILVQLELMENRIVSLITDHLQGGGGFHKNRYHPFQLK